MRFFSVCVVGFVGALPAVAMAGAGPAPPAPVSPGETGRIVSVAAVCPTFSWATVATAESYDLAVFSADEGDGPDMASEAEDPTMVELQASLPGRASSWTPALDRCLAAGRAYGWALRSVVQGMAGPWSEPRLFRVAVAMNEETDAGRRAQALFPSQPESAMSSRAIAADRTPAAAPEDAAASNAAAAAAPAAGPPLSVNRSDGGFLLAEFRNQSTSSDRSALVDIRNGNAVPITWRMGVGGAGNGLGFTAGEFYLERVGAGATLRVDTNGIISNTGYPAFVGRFQTSGGCLGGVVCGVTGFHNTTAVRGEATSSGGTGVVGQADGTDGIGVLGGALATGGIGIRGLSTVFDGVPGEFETTTLGGDILIGKAQATKVFRVDYTGKGFFNGGTQTGGADFAESMAVAAAVGDYEPGDVMAIDRGGRRRLVRAAHSYSTLVAGVVSTKPGVLATPHAMDAAELAAEIPLAVMGIVPCKVSAENGPIRAGDLLVTSSTPGHAMRGSRRRRMPGAVLGKALEPLARGTGIIEVLVTLQ